MDDSYFDAPGEPPDSSVTPVRLQCDSAAVVLHTIFCPLQCSHTAVQPDVRRSFSLSVTGAHLAPLGPLDPLSSFRPLQPLPPVTIVSYSVAGSKLYAASSKGKDALNLHLELMAVMRGALRQVPGGYLVRRQAAEFKYLLVFDHPEVGSGHRLD